MGTNAVREPWEPAPAVRRFELLDAASLDDPYPLYKEIRSVAPVYRDRRFLGWILTRYEGRRERAEGSSSLVCTADSR
jgi:hypothetical protein